MLNRWYIWFFRTEIQEELKHRCEGFSIFIPAADIPDSHIRITKETVYLIHAIHRVSNAASTKWQCYGFRHIPTFQKHGKLKVCVEGEQIEIKMSDEAKHGFPFVSQPGSFNVNGPFGQTMQEGHG